MSKPTWTPGTIRLATFYGRDRPPMMRPVAGWSDGVFGLDKRGCFNGWGERHRGGGFVITHLATGFAICGLLCSRKMAEKCVAILHEADWAFSDVADTTKDPARLAAKTKLNLTHPLIVIGTSEFDRPRYLDDVQGYEFAPASGMSAFGQDAQRLEAKPASPTGEAGDAQ